MKKLKKVALSLGIAGALLAGGAVVADQPAEAAWSYIHQSHFEKGTFVGWADSNSFEVKTSSGKHMVFRTSNNWYKENLKTGTSYTYIYETNKYGQNIITQIQK